MEEFFETVAKPQILKSFKKFREYYKSNSMDVEDVFQEIRIKVWQTMERYQNEMDEDMLGRYINRVVRNELIDIKRKSEKHMGMLCFNEDIKDKTDINKENKPLWMNDVFFKKLDKQQNKVLTLHFYEKMKFTEIAKEMKMTKVGVHYIYRSAIKKLKQLLNTK